MNFGGAWDKCIAKITRSDLFNLGRNLLHKWARGSQRGGQPGNDKPEIEIGIRNATGVALLPVTPGIALSLNDQDILSGECLLSSHDPVAQQRLEGYQPLRPVSHGGNHKSYEGLDYDIDLIVMDTPSTEHMIERKPEQQPEHRIDSAFSSTLWLDIHELETLEATNGHFASRPYMGGSMKILQGNAITRTEIDPWEDGPNMTKTAQTRPDYGMRPKYNHLVAARPVVGTNRAYGLVG